MASVRLAAAMLVLGPFVTACSTVPDAGSSDTQAHDPAAQAVRLTTEKPGNGYQRVARINAYYEAGCQDPRADEHKTEAFANLRQQAASNGADYVEVVGSGPLEERGVCADDLFRVTGVAYRSPHATEAAAASQSQMPADSSTASPSPIDDAASTEAKLHELERLHEEALISDAEYGRLRQRVLEEAF